jgi:hypothetical protein
MSGGALEYVYLKIDDAACCIPIDTIERIAFRDHLVLVAKALKAVEWNMSGDGADNESELIRNCLAPLQVLRTTITEAERIRAALDKEIARARTEMKKG